MSSTVADCKTRVGNTVKFAKSELASLIIIVLFGFVFVACFTYFARTSAYSHFRKDKHPNKANYIANTDVDLLSNEIDDTTYSTAT